jgi:tetratricopeptide (TPR) repeat protein
MTRILLLQAVLALTLAAGAAFPAPPATREEALADCDEVLKRNPRHFGALSGYGQIHFRLEQYEKAIEWWRRAAAQGQARAPIKVELTG